MSGPEDRWEFMSDVDRARATRAARAAAPAGQDREELLEALVDGIAYAIARAPVPSSPDTARAVAARLAPLVIESGFLSSEAASPAGEGLLREKLDRWMREEPRTYNAKGIDTDYGYNVARREIELILDGSWYSDDARLSAPDDREGQ